eukprot:TRINITY_DN2958_c1_g1_i1.p1 TRINITY_DN2958_c1_g1~~TRINITY_DN2958_c1_g1_i1.p1  ORF type:complete len:279 (+),score=56.68 TRINITY_DN2958_c1_g1_i1:52-888(+)
MFKNRAKKDRYNGVTVVLEDKECGRMDMEKFSLDLEEAVQEWREEGVRGVWMRLPVSGAHLIQCAVEIGFGYHHAKEDYLMMTMWLVEGNTRLPEQCHHQAGVGGLVLSGDGTKILVIKEKTGVTAGMKAFWKLPGGMVDSKEDVKDAAVREVREETGIKTVFHTISAFRETHLALFRNTDFYFVCVLKLDPEVYGSDTPTPAPTPCEIEVADATWMPIEDFLDLPFYRTGLYGELIKTSVQNARKAHAGIDITGMEHLSLPSFNRKNESMYRGVAKL